MYFINLILGLIFIALDLNNLNSSSIKYLTIFNNLLYLSFKHANNKAILTSVFTLIADYFLLFTNHQILGIICFLIVQTCYMKILNYHTYLPFLAIIFLPINTRLAFACSYALLSVANVIYSYQLRHNSKSNFYLFLAILLLLCCDFFVAITNIGISIPLFFRTLIWIFYLPSQLFFVKSQIILEK